jgi:hypothetical protein
MKKCFDKQVVLERNTVPKQEAHRVLTQVYGTPVELCNNSLLWKTPWGVQFVDLNKPNLKYLCRSPLGDHDRYFLYDYNMIVPLDLDINDQPFDTNKCICAGDLIEVINKLESSFGKVMWKTSEIDELETKTNIPAVRHLLIFGAWHIAKIAEDKQCIYSVFNNPFKMSNCKAEDEKHFEIYHDQNLQENLTYEQVVKYAENNFLFHVE